MVLLSKVFLFILDATAVHFIFCNLICQHKIPPWTVYIWFSNFESTRIQNNVDISVLASVNICENNCNSLTFFLFAFKEFILSLWLLIDNLENLRFRFLLIYKKSQIQESTPNLKFLAFVPHLLEKWLAYFMSFMKGKEPF